MELSSDVVGLFPTPVTPWSLDCVASNPDVTLPLIESTELTEALSPEMMLPVELGLFEPPCDDVPEVIPEPLNEPCEPPSLLLD